MEHLYLTKWDLETRNGYPGANDAAKYLTPDGRCVYSQLSHQGAVWERVITDHRLRPYTAAIERERRTVCDTALGQLVLDNPAAVTGAVRAVNTGIRAFVAELHRVSHVNLRRETHVNLPVGTTTLGDHAINRDGRHVSNATSFGRLAPVVPEVADSRGNPVPPERTQRGQMNSWLAAFNEPDLARQVGLHDVFLKVWCSYRAARFPGTYPRGLVNTDYATRLGLREAWYSIDTQRGRRDNAEFVQNPFYPALPGLIRDDTSIRWRDILTRSGVNLATRRTETRRRGVDANVRSPQMKPEYDAHLNTHNLLFVASVSGTTSTLLASAYTFAPAIKTDAELKRQYLLACVGYLVGSGMHSCDEVFYTGGRAALPYTAGKYLGMLPANFLASEVGQKWQNEFWELVRPDRPAPR